jgi:hypothetical protein
MASPAITLRIRFSVHPRAPTFILPFPRDDGIVVLRSERRVGMQPNAVPVALRERLGPEATENLLDLLERARAEWRNDVIEVCSVRFELRLVEEFSKLRVEMVQGDSALRQEMSELGANLRGEMPQLGASLRGEMAELGASLRGEMAQLGSSVRGEMAQLGSSVRGEMAELGASLQGEMAQLGSSVRGEMAQLGASLRGEMAAGRVELLKWCFLFWVGQLVAVAGVVGLMLRTVRP